MATSSPAPARTSMASSGDVCLKCDETRGAIRAEKLNCWDGYDELGKHRFVPWPDPPEPQQTPTPTGETP